MLAINREALGLVWTMTVLIGLYGAFLWYFVGGHNPHDPRFEQGRVCRGNTANGLAMHT